LAYRKYVSWIPDLLSQDQYCEIPDQDFQGPVATVTVKFNPQFHRLLTCGMQIALHNS